MLPIWSCRCHFRHSCWLCVLHVDTKYAIMPPVCVSYVHLQVPPPPAMDPAQEELLHQLMEVGYGNIRQ